jgi:hypothetical protein
MEVAGEVPSVRDRATKLDGSYLRFQLSERITTAVIPQYQLMDIIGGIGFRQGYRPMEVLIRPQKIPEKPILCLLYF